MKQLLMTILLEVSVMLAIAMPAHAEQPNRDIEQIKLQLQSMGTLADQNAFEYLGRIFSNTVVVDYTSAFGGEPATVNRADLMKSWAGLLPGFDLTRHELSNIEIKVMGNKATANADIKANHYLIDPKTGDEGFWQINGSYRYQLEKGGKGWTITALTLIAGSEQGSREVLGKASELAGTKRGIQEFTDFFSKLGKAGFQAQVMILAANDTYVIDAHRGWSSKADNSIDLNWVLLYQIEDGKIKRVQNFSGDLYASDRFFDTFFAE